MRPIENSFHSGERLTISRSIGGTHPGPALTLSEMVFAFAEVDEWEGEGVMKKYFAPPSLFEYFLNTIYYCMFRSGVKLSTKDQIKSISESITDTHYETIG